MTTDDLVENYLHASGIDVRQYQTVKATILWADDTIGLGVLLRHHGAYQRPVRAATPAVVRIREASESRFILKHQAQRLLVIPVGKDFIQAFLEFFFQSSRTSGFPFGCTVSGASLRQPLRANIR